MKLRRSFVHAFLSLLLLLSQQIALSHAYTHLPWLDDQAGQVADAEPDQNTDPVWSQSRLQADDDDDGQSIGSEHDCAQCHAVAQIAFAIYSSFLALAPDASKVRPVAAPITFIACLVTVCVFQSRAPPVA